jgi:hypothetical protein
MCELCEKARNSAGYVSMLSKMLEEDMKRVDSSKRLSDEIRLLRQNLYTSVNWPVKISYPMFDARAAYSVPHNYFQNLYLDGERLGVAFAHGAMRSLFFADSKLMLFSKSVNRKAGQEFFTSFILLHLESDEYKFNRAEDGTLLISADVTKPMKNLVTDKVENKKILFNFTHKPVKGRIVTREKVLTSAQFRNVYSKYGGAQLKSASIDLEGYAITVPHFAPHPYMLQLNQDFGFASNRQFQENVIEYFNAHLGFRHNLI